MQGSIYAGADEVEVGGDFTRDPLLDDKERTGNKAKYTLKFLSAFSKGPDRKKGSKGFFKTRVEVLTSEGDAALPVGTTASIMVFPRDYDAHIKDIKRLIGAITGTTAKSVSEENIDEVVADNPDEGGEGKLTGIVFAAELERNERGFMNARYAALVQPAPTETRN
mgnify:CR=1 FL=1